MAAPTHAADPRRVTGCDRHPYHDATPVAGATLRRMAHPLPTPVHERAPAAADRWLRLDAVRAAAAIMVLAHHVVASGMWDMGPLRAFAFEGYRGVLVFFVLSGFVIARPFARGPVPTGPFLARRALRIMPAYVIDLLGVTLISGDATFLAHPVQHLL